MKRNLFLLLFAASLYMVGCDYVDDPIEEVPQPEVPSGINPDTVETATVIKKILIEDFTGQGCQGCPDGHVQAKKIQDDNPDHVILVSIHSGWFADGPNNPHTPKFFTPDATPLHDLGPIANYPQAYINRTESNGNISIEKGAWSTFTSSLLNQTPYFGMAILTDYDETESEVQISVVSRVQEPVDGTYTLALYFVEDKPVYPQTLLSGAVDENYEQPHMLRELINGTWGENLLSGPAAVGETFLTERTYSIDPSWNVDNCTIVAFIRDAATEEIVQVEEVHVK